MGEDKERTIGIVTIKNREELDIDNVLNISSFDEDYLSLNSKMGKITVEGRELKVEDLNRDTGKIKVSGFINALIFSNDNKKMKRGLFS